MSDTVKKAPYSPAPIINFFLSPSEQVVRFKELNTDNFWGFAESDIPEIPKDILVKDGEVLTLSFYFPKNGNSSACIQTFSEHMEALEIQLTHFGQRLSWPKIMKNNLKSLRLISGVEHKPGIYWTILNYKQFFNPANGHRVSDIISGTSSTVVLAASEILSAILLNPDWIRGMGENLNGVSVPDVTLPGYEWNNKVLRFDLRGANILKLNFYPAATKFFQAASPTVRHVRY